MKQLLRPCVMLSLAGTLTAAIAQGVLPPCNSLPPAERETARAIGACREVAPIVDVAPIGPTAPSVVVSVPSVVGLTFDDARDRLAGFTVRRSYVPSAEPGGTVLEQQPAPPTRLPAGTTVRVVLSDGALRPAPRVAATEIDGVRKPPELPSRASSATGEGAPSAVPAVARRSEAEARIPSVPNGAVPARGLTGPQKSRASSKTEVLTPRSGATSSRATNRVKAAQIPARSAVAPTPAIEIFELPNVIGRSSADAGTALAEFKVERIEVVANAAPSGQVLAQDPAPGTLVRAGSSIGLQVSDGSLASVNTATAAQAPRVTPAPTRSAAPAPTRPPLTFPSTAVLLLIAGVLLGLGLGAQLMRRWLAKRHRADAEVVVPTSVAPAVDAVTPHETTFEKPTRPVVSPGPAAVAPPMAVPLMTVPAVIAAAITFAARLDEGETAVEFAAPPDADEMALEYSRDLHE